MIQTSITEALVAAWSVAGEALKTLTYRDGRTVGSYDVANDAQNVTWAHVFSGIKGFRWDQSRQDQPGETHSAGACRLILRQMDCPGLARPTTEGIIEIAEDATTVIYEITGVQIVPMASIYILTLQEHRGRAY